MKNNMSIKSITINEERITADEYIDFLKRSELGSQYPKERFLQRIEKLVNNTTISLIARNQNQKIVGVLFALTDFCYWIFVTDIGVDKEFAKMGIGTKLMQKALALAGGEKDIAMYLVANDKAIPFYEKLGMEKSTEVMQYNHIDWTDWRVE